MQLVPRDVLLKLASDNTEVTEVEGRSFSYDEFLSAYKKNLEFEKKYSKSHPDIYKLVYSDMKRSWLKEHCPPIQYVATGSSRSAFICSGGKCLKIAINEKGVAQNRQEVKNISGDQYECFPQLYGYDESEYSSILEECCSKANESDFVKLFGFTEAFDDLEALFEALDANSFDVKKTIEYAKDIVQNGFDSYMKQQLHRVYIALNNCMKNTMPQWKALNALIQFYKDHGGSELLFDDLLRSENWGLAVRDGKKLTLVIIDSGYSDEVYDKYYK